MIRKEEPSPTPTNSQGKPLMLLPSPPRGIDPKSFGKERRGQSPTRFCPFPQARIA